MKLTSKQAEVLANLHRVEYRRVGGRWAPFLDGRACKFQLNSLCAKGIVALPHRGSLMGPPASEAPSPVPRWPLRRAPDVSPEGRRSAPASQEGCGPLQPVGAA